MAHKFTPYICLNLDTDGNHVRYIEDLDLSHIGTVIVPNSAFVHYTVLNRLNLANASIQSIDDTWFNSNNNILELNLHHNELSALRRVQFRNLRKLRLLQLMDNNIESIEQNTFHDLNQLTHLNLRFNKLRTLNYFGNLNRLQSLNLGENSIFEVRYSRHCQYIFIQITIIVIIAIDSKQYIPKYELDDGASTRR